MSLKNKSIVAVVAVVAMSAGFWLSTLQQNNNDRAAGNTKEEEIAEARKRFSPIQGAIISPARKIAVPALTKGDGTAFTLQDLTGHWSLLSFGYTNCPDVCPVTMGTVAQAKKAATEINHIFPQVIFVSVDPERDKLEMLSDYVQYFDKDFVGVTGDENMIKALTLQMSVAYMKMAAEEGSEGYVVDHSSSLLLLNPEGKLVAFFNPPHDPKIILKDFQTIVNLNN
ncbi:MAG: SCO family protein [Proteobacteria bacterium]|nr:SCO family protein [Pseudomonadota bacterium]